MRPFDPRLVRYARAARGLLGLTVFLGVGSTALIIMQAGLLARVLAAAARGVGPAVLGSTLTALLLVVAGRAALSWAGETSALRASATVRSQLRCRARIFWRTSSLLRAGFGFRYTHGLKPRTRPGFSFRQG